MANYVLEILDGDRAGEVISVADRPLRIGRKPGNDLVLADEKTSGVHAEVVLEGDRHVLRDLGSTNGTFLDGKRLTELVLTPGDVVTIGRLRVKFRADGEAAPVAAGDLAMRTLDSSRLQRRSGSLGLLAALVVLGLGAAGWFWWQSQTTAAADDGSKQGREPVAVVANNKLTAEQGGCENEGGWTMRAAGLAFVPTTAARTGDGAFVARHPEPGGDAGSGNAGAANGDSNGGAKDDADFAVLRKAEPVAVLNGRTMTLSAYVRTADGGQAALRALLTATNEQVPFTFRTGTPIAAADGWQRLEVEVAIPSGCDKLNVEVVAVLPTPQASVTVDDIAIVEAGTGSVLEAKLGTTNQTALGTGTSLAVRSVDVDNPAIVLGVLPDRVPDALQRLHRADLCVLSDVGATLACEPVERGFKLTAQNVPALRFVLPADAASSLLVAEDGAGYESKPADGEFAATALLVGDRLTRAMFRFPSKQSCRGRTAGNRWSLSVDAAECELVLVFPERQQADQLLRQARRARDEGRPGEALDKLRDLIRTLPMDSEVLAHAVTLRAEILAGQSERVRALQQELDVASFFSTRGGFERIALDVDQLEQLYGKNNLEDPETLATLRGTARARLAAIDGKDHGAQRTRLEQLAKTFEASGQQGLAALVQDYVGRNLK